MHRAQFVLSSTQSSDSTWTQVSKVRNVLWSRKLVFGLGRSEQGADGRVRTVFVDSHADTTGTRVPPAKILVAEDPTLDTRTLMIESSSAEAFADMLGAVERNVDAIPLGELARQVRAMGNVDALARLGLGLVGVRYDRESYHALSAALRSGRAGIRAKAAQISASIGWRSLLRPLWGALARQTPATSAHAQISNAFAALDQTDNRTRYVLSPDTIVCDIKTLSRITFDFSRHGLVETSVSSNPLSSWTLRTQDGALAWRAGESEGVLVLEVGEGWREKTLGLVQLLNVESRVSLLEAASEKREGSLLRLVQSSHAFDPLVDELLVEGLSDRRTDVRLDALISIATAEWDSAIPDLEDMVEGERDLEARQLARAMLIQQRGY